MKLNNVRLLVSNFDDCFRFYRDVLGLTATWGDLGEHYAQFQVGDSGSLSLFSKDLMAQVVNTTKLPAQQAAQDSVALIFSVDNLDQIYKNLLSKKVNFINPPTDQPDW